MAACGASLQDGGRLDGEKINHLRGATALVTGASGFIGGHLCRRLAAAGAAVHAISRQASVAGFHTVHTLDLADGPAIEAVVMRIKPDYVFHLASYVSGTRDLSAVDPTFAINLGSTVHLLRAVTNTSCRRIVLAGSLEEPGSDGDVPSSPYAAAKAAASMYGRMFWQLYQTPAVVARVFMVYGAGQHDTKKLVPYVTTSLLKGESPKIGSGVRPVDWVYVDDVAAALIGCATADDLAGKTIDIGTGRLTTVRRVVEQLADLIGGPLPSFGAVNDRQLEQVRAADPTAMIALLGRDPVTLNVGLQRTIEWYRDNQLIATVVTETNARNRANAL